MRYSRRGFDIPREHDANQLTPEDRTKAEEVYGPLGAVH